MQEVKIRDEFIKLCQALKLAGLVDSGAEAKEAASVIWSALKISSVTGMVVFLPVA